MEKVLKTQGLSDDIKRKETFVYIKILDYMVKTAKEQKAFFDLFSDISDEVAIEHLQELAKEIDYTEIAEPETLSKSLYYENAVQSNICASPFYTLYVDTEGDVYPCCKESPITGIVKGNVNENTIPEIWNSKGWNEFRLKMLGGIENCGKLCKECKIFLHTMTAEDVLDNHAKFLADKYREILR